ncbi:hypothetical protein ACFE04_000465 [Oxalis oulophora]
MITLVGPCKAPIEVRVKGILKAPAELGPFNNSASWVTFNYIDHFTLSGKGTFDGQGSLAWTKNDCNKNTKCIALPINLRFNFVNNATVRGVTSLNSKNFHVNVLGCKNFTFVKFNIIAPDESPNTDGIHIGRSTGIKIKNTFIGTGDDCISIGDGNSDINIRRVSCGPGHGISIGSLGRSPGEEPVTRISVRNCTLLGTTNGLRVKTWPSSPADSVVSDLRFEDIIMMNVSNPRPSRVKISNVSFKNIRGTSASQTAVKLVCSEMYPCQNVEMADIDLTSIATQGPATSICTNVSPRFYGSHNPPACVST